jgi:Arc/MetJ-type ribon-helix-helix transcriptional regulator
MKNITVSLDDETYRQARVKAAGLDSSVSALVRKYLIELAGTETDFDRRKRLQAETLATIRSFSAGDRLKRDEVHQRPVAGKRRAVR